MAVSIAQGMPKSLWPPFFLHMLLEQNSSRCWSSREALRAGGGQPLGMVATQRPQSHSLTQGLQELKLSSIPPKPWSCRAGGQG